jgi:secernin
MCDTMVALANSTADGSVLFAKNSDREPNEASMLVIEPAADHIPDSRVKCTYIDIPQVEHTNRVLLLKPFWIWGAEMGANEFGVVIGNEAVFSKEPYGKEPGLIGMDLLRLALERADGAEKALEVIVTLLAEFGQSGNCGFSHTLYYHNSFLIADRQEAWVLETAGKEWAAEKVRDIRSISNGYTISSTWDMESPNLVEHAIQKGWCRNRTEFDLARSYSDFIYTRFSDSRKRQQCSTNVLRGQTGTLTPVKMMQALRYHEAEDQDYSPARGILGADVCMYAGFGPARGSQSAGSIVSRLTPGSDLHFLTGTSAPCTGIFKPVWLDAGLPDLEPAPTGAFDPQTLFWKHEQLHRAVLRNYSGRLAVYADERDTLEEKFVSRAEEMIDLSLQERSAFTRSCFAQADEAESAWFEKVSAVPASKLTWHYRRAWIGFNKSAKISAA